MVSLKAKRARKGRLAPRLDPEGRIGFSELMAAHVLACLAACSEIDRVLLLSPEPPAWPEITWRRDERRGLNGELKALRDRERDTDLLVIHADLPLLSLQDVDALLAAAVSPGLAIASDRHQTGTNALAMRAGRTIDFAFGPDSLARHLAQAPQAAMVRRPGLMLDVDTPEDLDIALAAGFQIPAPVGRLLSP